MKTTQNLIQSMFFSQDHLKDTNFRENFAFEKKGERITTIGKPLRHLSENKPMTEVLSLEDKLIRGCQEGEESAQYRVYKNYVKAMYNIAVRMTGNQQDAEEVIQDAFLTVFRKIRDFRRETTLGVWIRRIVINRCIDHIRKRKPMYDLMMNIPDVPEEDEPGIMDPEKVHHVIRQLPDGARTILSLFLLEGLSHREIAGMLKISESTSKTQYHRAKQLLKRILKETNHESIREI